MVSVLFVCFANICRSPAAEGIFHYLVEKQGLSSKIQVESCGIGSWSVGQEPDKQMRQVAKERGFELNGKASQFTTDLYDKFDYILAVNDEALDKLKQHAQKEAHKNKIVLFTEYSQKYHRQGVPDPYNTRDDAAFNHVLDVVEDACKGLLAHIRKTL